MSNKIMTAEAAVGLIRDNDYLCTGGFVGTGVPEALLAALEERYVTSGSPRNLSLLFAAGQGDGKDKGLNHLGHEGLMKRVIGGHWGLIPKLGKLALANKLEAYNWPQGCISQLYRDIAAGKPGMLSRVGLNTFVDPALEGGRINTVTRESLLSRMTLNGQDYLFYPRQEINVALIRGTSADENGNISMEREALTLDNLAMATAVRNNGGKVLVQVERIVQKGSIAARDVKVPGNLVDAVVVAHPDMHMQTYGTHYNPAFSGEIRVPVNSIPAMPLNARKIIARRAAMELQQGDIVNLGIGMPEGLASVANEEGMIEAITLTAEPGVIGGVPAAGLDFGAAINTEALVDQNSQFDFYDGGGLDLACLGMAEMDQSGNVNVSRFGPKLAGAGGFINISQNAARVVFVGTFTAGGLELALEDGALKVVQEGQSRKFIEQVEQITFSSLNARASGQKVLYITERAVFELTDNGVVLTEIAPGIDLERDILQQMNFQPIIHQPKLMDARIFVDAPMGLKL